MIVDGTGMLAAGFLAYGKPNLPACIFARGVARSHTVAEHEYRREKVVLATAIERARHEDWTLVYFSGAPIYGDFESPAIEDQPVHPRARYGVHQADCEQLIIAADVSYLILRLPNIVGPTRNVRQLVPALVAQALAGRVHVQHGAERDLLDVEDLVAITMRLLEQDVHRRTLNVASGISTPVSDIVDTIIEILRLHPIIQTVDGGSAQHFDLTQLRRLDPTPAPDADYWQRVLRRYVAGIATAISEKTFPPVRASGR